MNQPLVQSTLVWYALSTLVAFAGIIARLCHLQIVQQETLCSLSTQNFRRIEKLESPRGNMYDYRKKLLATNRPVVVLHWQGCGNRTLSPEQEAVLKEICAATGQEYCLSPELLMAERLKKTYIIASDISFEELSNLIERFPNHPQLFYTTPFKRYYPHKEVTSHLLGYLGGSVPRELEGKMGLEKLCDETLRGNCGEAAHTVNARGIRLATEHIREVELGGTLNTTIDLELSIAAQEIFPKETAGCLLVMDSLAGGIRVMLSNPTFDPNIFLTPLTTESWQELQRTRPFVNRVCCASYPPASLFKLITMAAALETGVAHQSDTWCCNGFCMFAGREYHCARRTGHGFLTTQQVIAQSCNIPFFEIAKRIKIDTLAEYAHRLGFGENTGCILPEKTGLIPTRAWKRAVKKESWWPGETLSAAIGQSYLLATPLQIARMLNGVCEGVLVTPRILEDEPVIRIPVDISRETCDFLKQSMRKTIEAHGTGSTLRRLKDMVIYGKTGTAQVSAYERREDGKEFLEHGYLAAQVTYKDNDPIVLVIFLEHVASSSVATQVALHFLRAYAKIMDAREREEAAALLAQEAVTEEA